MQNENGCLLPIHLFFYFFFIYFLQILVHLRSVLYKYICCPFFFCFWAKIELAATLVGTSLHLYACSCAGWSEVQCLVWGFSPWGGRELHLSQWGSSRWCCNRREKQKNKNTNKKRDMSKILECIVGYGGSAKLSNHITYLWCNPTLNVTHLESLPCTCCPQLSKNKHAMWTRK